MSVYGSFRRERALNEDDPAAPDEPYGAAKRAVELIGENLSKNGAIHFVALRIARVVGPGIRKSSSPWRSHILEARVNSNSIRLPFSPDALLSLVHVEDVARMLGLLLEAAHVKHSVYNTPVEIWEARQLKEALGKIREIPVELDCKSGDLGGPMCDGSRFSEEFNFRRPSLCDRLRVASRH
jgi:nucleoside-diphosphate-sugar epimerase